jgi:hypothetical protein
MTEERPAWRVAAFVRSISLGFICGAALGIPLGLFLSMIGGNLLAVPFTVVVGAIIGAVGGLTGGLALIACGPAVCRSRALASLVTGTGASAIPFAVTVWILARHWAGGANLAIASTLIAFASGAGFGPLAAAGVGGWTRSRPDPGPRDA